jgi:hypothetical protein
MRRIARRAWELTAIAVAGLCLAIGCGGLVPFGTDAGFRYFQRPASDDPWSGKIGRWQERERAEGVAQASEAAASTVGAGPEAPATGSPDQLRAKYLRFRADHKRSLARETASWLQEQAKLHYVPDGVLDRWATLEETLAHNGDDCDGLELLAYNLLLDLGFHRSEVYRAIVLRPADGQHHMVTMWFEDPSDPWVIDPTGAMTTGMPRMSQVAGWIPLKLFSESEEWTVSSSARARARAAAVPLPAASAPGR